MRILFAFCSIVLSASMMFAQNATPTNAAAGAPSLDIPQTLAYINEKIKEYSDKPENIRKIMLTKEGVIEERFGQSKTHYFYLTDIAKTSMELFSEGVYRVRLECKSFESSCITSSNSNEIMKHHTNFYIIDRREAESLQKAWVHLMNLAKDQIKNTDPFANFSVGEPEKKGPPKRRRRRR